MRNEGGSPDPRPPYFWVMLASLLGGGLLIWLSMNIGERPDRLEQSIGRGLSMLQGQPYVQGEYQFYMSMFQNRILVPGAQRLLMALGLSSVAAFTLVYAVTAITALVACWLLFFRLSIAHVGLSWLCWLWLVVAAGLTFIEPWIQATEFLELFLLSWMVLAVVTKQRWLLVWLVLIGIFNRETAIYGVMLWGLVHGLRPGHPKFNVREMAFALFFCLMAYTLVELTRYVIGGEKAFGHLQTQTWWLNPNQIRHAWGDLWGYGHWLLRAMLMLWLPLCLMLLVGAARTPLGKRFFFMALLVCYAVFNYGVVGEIRLFLPAVLFLLCAVAARKNQAAYP